MENALIGFDVRQHAPAKSISKRAPSSASAAFESGASYGEMSRRSGFAAQADNHSDISPLGINDLHLRLKRTKRELCQPSECAAIIYCHFQYSRGPFSKTASHGLLSGSVG
jgi:hypothetical protein